MLPFILAPLGIFGTFVGKALEADEAESAAERAAGGRITSDGAWEPLVTVPRWTYYRIMHVGLERLGVLAGWYLDPTEAQELRRLMVKVSEKVNSDPAGAKRVAEAERHAKVAVAESIKAGRG